MKTTSIEVEAIRITDEPTLDTIHVRGMKTLETAKLTRFQDIPQLTEYGSWECDFPLDSVWEQVQKWMKEGLDIDPDFQRLHVWNEQQQIAWLEFFLRGGKSGRVIYFNHPGWMRGFKGEFLLVDGKQRLEAIRRFLQGEIQVFGSYFSEYTDRLRIHRTMKLHVNNLQTRAQVLQWYIEFNAGGTPHSPEEIAKAERILSTLTGDSDA